MAYKPQAGAQMASPNVIPMADIMLVLLIIFMVVTPLLTKDIPVDMPSAANSRDMQDADIDDAILDLAGEVVLLHVRAAQVDPAISGDGIAAGIAMRLLLPVSILIVNQDSS